MNENQRKKLASLMLTATICASSVFACGVFTACDGAGMLTGQSTLTLNKTMVKMCTGDTLKLTAKASDESAVVTWSTSDSKVVTVKRGTLTAKGAGRATVTASLADGTKATCTVTVEDRVITISQTELTVNLDETRDPVTLTAESSDGKAVEWLSSDTAIATVNGGVVTFVGDEIGDVIITAQAGTSYAECVIHVTMPSRPESFKRLTSAQNAACVADPGNWHYFADGSSSAVTFADSPYYQLGEDGKPQLGYSISEIHADFLKANGEKKKLYFRFQPAADSAGEALAVGDKFKIEFDVLCSQDSMIKVSGNNVGTTTAGETMHCSYTLTVKADSPMTIRPSFEQAPSADNPFTWTITGITLTKVVS